MLTAYSVQTRRATGDGNRQTTVGSRAAPGICCINSRTCFELFARKQCRPGSSCCSCLASGARLRSSKQAGTWHLTSSDCASVQSLGTCISSCRAASELLPDRPSASRNRGKRVLAQCLSARLFFMRALNFICPRLTWQPAHGNLPTSFGEKPFA